MKKLLLILVAVAPVLAAASGYGGGDPHAIPWKTIFWQAVNLSIMVGILVYTAGKTVKSHFAEKREVYFEAIEKVARAKAEAEKKNYELKTRISKLEGTAGNAVENAKKEAAELRERIISEAAHAAKNVLEEARRTAKAETQRALDEIREEAIRLAVETSKNSMSKRIQETDQRRLQKEFVEKIGVVQA